MGLALLAVSVGACSGGSEPAAPADTQGDAADASDAAAPAVSVAEELGLTQYVGAITPVVESTDGAVTTFAFDESEGPVCMRGKPFRASVRHTASDRLLIFLQGGGACWSEFCLAVTGAPAGIPAVDVLNPELEANPVADWNVLYVPYCDGSLFAGDAEHDDDLNGNGVRKHRGLANLTAALEVAAREFPDVEQILLAGSSGGAYGLLLGAPLTRHYYPDTELVVMADSGIGLGRDGDSAFLQTILDEFDIGRFVPKDCEYCVHEGHITGVVRYFLERDANTRVGMFMAWNDSVLSATFLDVAPEVYAASVRSETEPIHELFPDRFRRFVVSGVTHTTLLGDPSGIIGTDLSSFEAPPDVVQTLLGGGLEIGQLSETAIGEVSFSSWLRALVDGDMDACPDLLEAR